MAAAIVGKAVRQVNLNYEFGKLPSRDCLNQDRSYVVEEFTPTLTLPLKERG